MTPLTVLHEAEVELREAVSYYEEKSKGLGLNFADEIETSFHQITEHPKRWSLRKDGT